MFKLVCILAFSLTILQYVSAACNTCGPNGAACFDEYQFYLCFDGKVNSSVSYKCLGENEICTASGRICMKKNSPNVIRGCGDISNCGKCEGQEDDGRFTCTSRTTFTMCLNGNLTNIRGSCSKNEICDVALGKAKKYPCVAKCYESKIKFCDLYDAIDVPVITTVKPPITTLQLPSTTKATPVTPNTQRGATTKSPAPTTPFSRTTATPDACSQQTLVGHYPNPNDTTCKTYVYCFRKRGRMNTSILKCRDNLYYDPSIRICTDIKPRGCV